MTEILASELFCGIDEKAAEDIIGELGAYEREYAPGEPFSRKKKGSILWAARMIDWKHPEQVVKIAA